VFDFGVGPSVDGSSSDLKNCRRGKFASCNITSQSIKMDAQLFGGLPRRNYFHSATSVDDRWRFVKDNCAIVTRPTIGECCRAAQRTNADIKWVLGRLARKYLAVRGSELMYISKFQVVNYKSYRETGEIELWPGFNIVVGQNSAGKTALLEALQLQFAWSPHRSMATLPVAGSMNSTPCSVRLSFAAEPDELLALLKGIGTFWLAAPQEGSPNRALFQQDPPAFLNWIFSHHVLTVAVRVDIQSGNQRWVPDGVGFGVYPTNPPQASGQVLFRQIEIKANGNYAIHNDVWADVTNDVTVRLAQMLKNRIYRFLAERYSIGECSFGPNPILAPNATNLPEVLDSLTANTARFERFNRTVHEIFPQVKHVSVRNMQGRVQIIVWPHEYASERVDLAIPLNECGSGIGQVLAILYVVMNSETPQVILVDEPQSFLHPGAVRKLIEVLKRYPDHQYIFATHSPAVITAAEPVTLTVARYSNAETRLQKIDPANAKQAREYLSEIGARLSDVFGADHVLWVEGQTEEECFPLLLKLLAKQHNQQVGGIAVVGIRQTGDLQGRDKKKILEIYNKLSEANTLVPPTIAFIFDRECLSAGEQEELRKMGHGRVHFLPRRMYENYLLDPEAIAAVANMIEGFRTTPIAAEDVGNLFATKRNRQESGKRQLQYFCKGVTQVPEDWVRTIHAAGLLKDVFSELSENRVAYEKTTHSIELTKFTRHLLLSARCAPRRHAGLLSAVPGGTGAWPDRSLSSQRRLC
jgi:predicted ATPase